MLKKVFTVIALGIATLTFSCQTASAASAQEGLNYSVTVQQPKQQMTNTNAYFQLLVKPRQTITLTLKVHNQRNQERQVKIAPVSAYTNDNGVIAYQRNPQTVPATQQFSRFVSNPQVVKIGPKSTKRVTFKLKTPKNQVAGMIDGGFKLTPIHEKQHSQSQKGFSIKNHYAMVVGATMQMNRQPVTPKVSTAKVIPHKQHGRLAVGVRIKNNAPTAFGQMTVKATIQPKGGDSQVFHDSKTNLQMAPHSSFNYQFIWPNQKFEPGTYRLKMAITSGTKKWLSNQTFTITKAQARRLNPRSNALYWWLIGLLLIIVGSLSYWRIRQRKRQV